MKVVKKIKAGAILAIIILCIAFIKKIFASNVTSVEDFKGLMENYGMWGPLILTLIQAIQVVIPVLPGYLGCAVGAISYGTVTGFICNYVGISLGSIVAFFLAMKFGQNIVIDLFSEKQLVKWKKKIEQKRNYNIFLFIATLLPLFPDDFLCYFSGLIGMDKKKFCMIIVLGKPWCILAYSILFGLV